MLYTLDYNVWSNSHAIIFSFGYLMFIFGGYMFNIIPSSIALYAYIWI